MEVCSNQVLGFVDLGMEEEVDRGESEKGVRDTRKKLGLPRNGSITSSTMANYLLLHSLGGGVFNNILLDKTLAINGVWGRSDIRSLTSINQYDKALMNNSTTTRVFECKTCNRQFPSFQALGGHRASHKKPKLMSQHEDLEASPAKPKIHECSICGLEFNIGQALGGHMRRHRGDAAAANEDHRPPLSLVSPVVKKSNSRRIMCLDLNLTPMENDIEFELGKKVAPPMVNCFL